MGYRLETSFRDVEDHAADLADKPDCMLGDCFTSSTTIYLRGKFDVEEFVTEVAEGRFLKDDEFQPLGMMPLMGGIVEMPSEIQEAITASRSILELEDDWDDQESPRMPKPLGGEPLNSSCDKPISPARA